MEIPDTSENRMFADSPSFDRGSSHFMGMQSGTSAFSSTVPRVASPYDLSSGNKMPTSPQHSQLRNSLGSTSNNSENNFQFYGGSVGFASTGSAGNQSPLPGSSNFLAGNSSSINDSYSSGYDVNGNFGSNWNGSGSHGISPSSMMIDSQYSTRGSSSSANPFIGHSGAQEWQPGGSTNGGASAYRGVVSPQDPSANIPFLQQQSFGLSTGEFGQGMGMMSNGSQHASAQRSSNPRYSPSALSMNSSSTSRSANQSPVSTGGSNAQGRALNKMLLEILRDRLVDPNRLAMAIDANIERMDCVNLATLLFHTGKKRLLLTPSFIKRIAGRFNILKEELRAREASNALYGLKCMSSECVEVRQLVFALANKVAASNTELVAQAVGNALYGCQMMTSDHEEVRYLLQVLAIKVSQCAELLEAQNVGNALYGLRGMASDYKEVRSLLSALTPKVATAREDLNGQALGNSLYGLQGMSSREQEVRSLLNVLAQKVLRCREPLKAQEVGNALYGLKRMSSDVIEVRQLIEALVPKVSTSPEILDAQAIGNSFYGMQNMRADNAAVLLLLGTMADKVSLSGAELDGQAMGNSLYGLQGMSSEHVEVRAVVNAITLKIQSSVLEMNAQELGNALYGLQNMTSDFPEVRRLMLALSQKVASSKHELTSQEIGNALFGLQGMRSSIWETRVLVYQMASKIHQSHSLIDPQGISNSLFGIQRMTSDCEEVRMLVQALAGKIELSWKLLSAQHLANAIFGLQGLSSVDTETNALIHALVPKILACRDEINSKQICNALFGLKNMNSVHEDVLPMISALTEKLSASTEIATIRSLGTAMFGLQGMEGSTAEVRSLVGALAHKLAAAEEIDASSTGNCVFGLQRMDNTSPEVCALLNILASLIVAMVDSGIELTAQFCANALYGLQNCSITDENTRSIMYVVVNRLKELMNDSSISSPSNNSNSPASLSLSAVQQGPLSRFADLLGIHQALSLVVPVQPDLELDPDLQTELLSLQSSFAQALDDRKVEFRPVPMSLTEARLIEGVKEVLAKEPFAVTSAVLLYGFTACVVVRLKPGIELQTAAGERWSPVLVIEPSGGANENFPRRQLFTRLKHEYLRHAHSVVVKTVPVSILLGKGRGELREKLLEVPDLFHSLYPPTVEDASKFSSSLASLGFAGSDGFMSTLHSSGTSTTASFFAAAAASLNPISAHGGGAEDQCDGSLECCLDFYETAPSVLSARGVRVNPYHQGMSIGWIGDPPTAPTAPSSHPRPSLSSRSPAVLPSSNGISVVPNGSTSKYAAEDITETVTAGGALGQPFALPAQRSLPMRPLQGSKQSSPDFVQTAPSVPAISGSPRDPNMQMPTVLEISKAGGILISQEARRASLRSTSVPVPVSRSVQSESPATNPEDVTEDVGGEQNAAVDSEIELLEAQLEIARLEARLLQLRKAKVKVAKPGGGKSPDNVPASDANAV